MVKSVIGITLVLTWFITGSLNAQVVRKIEGYASIIERRFQPNGDSLWRNRLDANMDELIILTLKKSCKYEMIIPLQYVSNNQNDTLIYFFYTKKLKTYKKRPIQWSNIDSNLLNHSIICINKREIRNRNIDFDSVALLMRENIQINSKNFDLEKYLDENISNFCYQGKNERDIFEVIYLFFKNGIILSEDPHTGRLHYLSY
jgi:hypothetical protein